MAAPVLCRPAISRAADRPLITHGVQSGDVSVDGAVVWSRADRPARMIVEVSTTEASATSTRRASPTRCRKAISPPSCCSTICPRAKHVLSRALRGSVVSGAVGRGADRTFPHAGSRVAARSPSPGRATLPGRAGASTRRAAACAAFRRCSPTAGLLHPFRRRHLCRLSDRARIQAAGRRGVAQSRHRGQGGSRADARAVPRQLQIQSARPTSARFNAQVPVLAQWDDHEVTNDWWPHGRIEDEHYTQNAAPRCWRRAGAARSVNTCRCASRRSAATASIGRSPMVRCSMCS